MRLAQVGTVALTFMVGCVRFGYDPLRAAPELVSDAARGGRSVAAGASGAAGGARQDASVLDASSPMDASVLDAASDAAETSASDAASASDGSDDGAVQEPVDSGPTDAGSSDAATSDGGPVGPVDRCPERSDVLFCDDFEDPELGRWDYHITHSGTAEQTTALSHSGTGSLHADTSAASADGAASDARYGVEAFAHQKSGEIWVRYYYYVPSSITVNYGFSSVVVAEIEPPYFGFSLVILPSRVDIAVLDKTHPGMMMTPFPRDQWTCVELHVQIDAAAGIFEAYLDGKLAVKSPATDTLPDKGYTSLDVGIHYASSPQGPVTAYVDDVVAGNTRVGCDVATATIRRTP